MILINCHESAVGAEWCDEIWVCVYTSPAESNAILHQQKMFHLLFGDLQKFFDDDDRAAIDEC